MLVQGTFYKTDVGDIGGRGSGLGIGVVLSIKKRGNGDLGYTEWTHLRFLPDPLPNLRQYVLHVAGESWVCNGPLYLNH